MAPEDKGPTNTETGSPAVTSLNAKQAPKAQTVGQLITTHQQARQPDPVAGRTNFPSFPTPQQTNGVAPSTVANGPFVRDPANSWSMGWTQKYNPNAFQALPQQAANQETPSSPQTIQEKEHTVGLLEAVRDGRVSVNDIPQHQWNALDEETQERLQDISDQKRKPASAADDDDEADDANAKDKTLLFDMALAGGAAGAMGSNKLKLPNIHLPKARGSRSAKALARARKAARKARLKRDRLKRRADAARRRAEEAKRKHKAAEKEHEKLRLAKEEGAATGAEERAARKLATSEERLLSAEQKLKKIERLSVIAKKEMGGFNSLLHLRKFGEGLVIGYFAGAALKSLLVVAAAPKGQSSDKTMQLAEKVFYESAFSPEARAEFDKGNTGKGIAQTAKDFVTDLAEGAKDMANFVANGGIQKALDEWKWFVKFQKEHPEDAQELAQMLVKGALGDIPTGVDAAGNYVYGKLANDDQSKQRSLQDVLLLAKKANGSDPKAVEKLARIAGDVMASPPPDPRVKKPDSEDGPSRPSGLRADANPKPSSKPEG